MFNYTLTLQLMKITTHYLKHVFITIRHTFVHIYTKWIFIHFTNEFSTVVKDKPSLNLQAAAIKSILTCCKALALSERNFTNSTSLGTLDNGKESLMTNDNMKALVFQGCIHYIFASLFFKSKGEHLSNEVKCFLLHFKGSFRS